MSEIKVVELFAGVGGFRIGLEGWKGRSAFTGFEKKLNSHYKVIWGNQWEPSTKTQDAFYVYSSRFDGKHSNQDISKVIAEDFSQIPDHDMLVGGFPCQDYSVARTLNQAAGLKGKKGVLWWSIHKILEKKIEKRKPVKYLMLENVDRLLKSPATQRGRDFAIMLSSLANLGYAVEWRVINAADYGMPQRRRRVFFIGYHKSTPTYKKLLKLKDKRSWIMQDGVIADAFPVNNDSQTQPQIFKGNLSTSLLELTENFNKKAKSSPFKNSGIMINHEYLTIDTTPDFNGKETTLLDIIIKDENEIPSEYFIDENSLKSWNKLKGAKKEIRVSKDGFEYEYSEGSMVFPDALDKPSRTIVTGEGGSSPSRFKHVICSPISGRLRRLTPLELERLNMFPDNHTKLNYISDIKRAFFMGNALVVGIVDKLGRSFSKEIL
ncbi:MAG: DNA (cytosine-5-)-methyltransferase [Bacteroidetes bacterium]|nr:DNA (cytosine-5-)-methyltransferase [Bacteroidota bacterium]